jgi:hypothetical protein
MTKELVDAYEDFIRVLGEEINDMHGLCYVHGWRSKRGEIGQQCRERIAKAKVDMALLHPCAPGMHEQYKTINPSWVLCPLCGIKL